MYSDEYMKLMAQMVQTPFEEFSREQCFLHLDSRSSARKDIFADLVRLDVFRIVKKAKTFRRGTEGLVLYWPEKYPLLTKYGGLGYFRGFIYALPNEEPHVSFQNGILLDRALQGIKQQEQDVSLLKEIYRNYPHKTEKGIYLSALYFWSNITLSVERTGTAYFPHQSYFMFFKDKEGVTISKHEKEGGFYLKWDLEEYERGDFKTKTS